MHRLILVLTLVLVASAVSGVFAQKPASRSTRPPPLKLTIKKVVDAKSKHVYLRAEFENTTKKPLTVYRPQDGSYHGWLSPIYDLTIKEKGAKKKLTLPSRCGNHGADYAAAAVVIAPGKTAAIKVYVHHGMEKGKRYSIALRYAVRKGRYPGPSVSFPSLDEVKYGPWPDGVFVGEVASKSITVTW